LLITAAPEGWELRALFGSQRFKAGKKSISWGTWQPTWLPLGNMGVSYNVLYDLGLSCVPLRSI
jgi:hypothetical protein